MTVSKNSIYRVVLPIIVVLALPLIAMQFTDSVDWKLHDFIVMGIMLFIAGSLFEFARLQWKNKRFYIAAVIIIALTFLLVYVELAVGIFNTPLAGS